jgi:hypothetical protein
MIGRVDGDATTAPRAQLAVTLSIGGGPLSTAAGPVGVPLSLYGPGDITGLDVRTVIRTWPRPDVYLAEPNYFPLIELQPADLPWRYTPATANASDRLRPWLTLVVLRDDEIVSVAAPTSSLPLAVLTVASAQSLPSLDQSWAWAHVQITGETTVDEATALALLDTRPEQILARLLCPRRLDSRTVYTGFLVPSLQRAVLAGLRQAVPDTVDDMAPAWAAGDTNVQLPVYYQWRFQTGEGGDFESLVRLIQPRPTPSTVGSRPMDETHPGLALPAAAAIPLNAEAALRALDSTSTTWPDADKAAWTAALETVLNRPAALLAAPGGERVVAPPLYGQWYAALHTVDAANDSTGWFADLNIDPRVRVGSGLGTLVIQANQQRYLAGAWAQVAGIRAINAQLRAAQLAREAALRLYARHLIVRSDVSLVAVTAPVHARILASARTIAAVIGTSPLAAGLMTPAWRRLTRPRGPLGLRLARAGQVSGPTLIERVNAGTKRVAVAPATPVQLATLSRAGASLAPSWITPAVVARLQSLGQLGALHLLVAALLAALLFAIGGGAIALVLVLVVAAIQLFGHAIATSAPVEDLARRLALRGGTLSAAQLASAPRRPAFVPMELNGVAPVQGVLASGATEQPAATRFRTAVADVFGAWQTLVAAGPVLQPIDMHAARATIAAALDPRVTIGATFQQRLVLAAGFQWTASDPLEPVMAAPTFSDAMYWPLYLISQDWMLPGLDQVPQDTVSLVRTNQRFVESYMVGLNHEMGRTLLFNEYPTDQRGTYFQQFWDAGPTAAPTPDITPIAGWASTSTLGAHSGRPATTGGGDALVLLLRAELLRRYPNLVVYAARAKWNANSSRDIDDTNEQQPAFQGRLSAGVGFWGFDLTVSAVRGGTKPGDDPGWFFILQEAPTEPRFGLEPAGTFGTPPTDWPELAWSDLAPDATTLGAITYIDLGAALPSSTVIDPLHAEWHTGDGARASDLAYITYRVPVRVAVHGSTMIPPDAVGS